MACYVDRHENHWVIKGMKMCHLVADTTEELIEMEKIGVGPEHIQKRGSVHEHFDICQTKRRQAIAEGCIEVSYRQVFEIIKKKRELMSPFKRVKNAVNFTND